MKRMITGEKHRHSSELKPTNLAEAALEDRLAEQLRELRRRKRILWNYRVTIGLFLLALITWSWIGTRFSILDLFTGIAAMVRFISINLLPPDLSAIQRYWEPALQTLYMSYVGMVISVILSLLFGFMAAKNTSFHPLLAIVTRSFVTLLRAVPALVWAIVLVVAIGLGPFAGTLALGLAGIGILGKAFADIIEEIDQRQVEAVRATGANWLQVMGQGVWPQFKTGFVAWSLYKMDLNIREASILGLIGAGGIGYTLQGHISLFQYKQAATGILMIFALILLVEFTTAKIREKML